MTPSRIILALVLVMVAVLLAAGCAGQPVLDNHRALQTSPSEGENSTVIQLVSENVNSGDTVEFHLLNETSLQSSCPNYIPSYGVARLIDTGSWPWLPEPRGTINITNYSMNTGIQKPVYKFTILGWKPGRYRIQLDCGGVSKEFAIQEKSPSPPCPQKKNNTQFIVINPVGDHYLGEIFEVTGTTDAGINEQILYGIRIPFHTVPLGAGEPNYGVTSGYARVIKSECGIQTWSLLINTTEIRSWTEGSNLYYLDVVVENRTTHSRFTISNTRLWERYLVYPVPFGEPFTYHGTVPDPLPNNLQNATNSTDTDLMSQEAISEVHVWIFGDRYANMTIVPVNPDKSFDISMSKFRDLEIKNGTYRMLFQYPKIKNQFDISVQNGTYNVINRNGEKFLNFYDIPDSKISGFKVMGMLEQELKKPNSHDRYSIISIAVGDSPYVVTAP